ncbi:thioredoxin-disulfide reductase [Nanoarchaeota archaeon]|nr:MAG: thioredoxin-disulfide reductase [Nanoarchaeota archaeon]
MYDLIIVGAGAAGLSAGLYGVRYKLRTLVIGEVIGGKGMEAHLVENYPGFLSISGSELMRKFREQAEEFGAKILRGKVVEVRKEKGNFTVRTLDDESFESKAIILAMGSERRRLNIPGEDKLLGKGVSYCATCDGPLFKGKKVAVIGGSDAAVKSALILSEHAKEVHIIYRREKLRAEPLLTEKVLSIPKVKVVYNRVPVRVEGKEKVEALVLKPFKGEGKEEEFPVDGVFIEIGDVPSTSIAKELGVKLDEEGYVEVNPKTMETNVKGVYAAGDITNVTKFKQFITAASQGALAAYSAYLFLKGGKK